MYFWHENRLHVNCINSEIPGVWITLEYNEGTLIWLYTWALLISRPNNVFLKNKIYFQSNIFIVTALTPQSLQQVIANRLSMRATLEYAIILASQFNCLPMLEIQGELLWKLKKYSANSNNALALKLRCLNLKAQLLLLDFTWAWLSKR